MDLHVVFGSHLDGSCYPEEQPLGHVVLGPLGLLQQLAMRLGLLQDFPEQAVRIGHYVSALSALDDGNRFYSRSFARDAWGTARSLLHLRDDLVGSGWRGQGASTSERLKTLAEIESTSAKKLLCLTDLCATIADATESETGLRFGFAALELTDKQTSLPPIWQRILKGLAKNGVLIQERVDRINARDSDLTRIANYLLEQSDSCKLTGDGSFLIVESDDEVQAADFFASWLDSCRDEIDDRSVIIKGGQCSFLDRLLHQVDLPALGSASGSKYRSGLQLLSLALDMCWLPVNPTRIVELLMLPNAPIPPFAASCFLGALKNEPGIGGKAWRDAWLLATTRLRKALETREQNASITVTVANLNETEATWREWLEPLRFESVTGVPAPRLVAVCTRVKNHALKVFNTSGLEVFAQTAIFAETLSKSIEASGFATVSRAQLDRMVDSVFGDGLVDKPQAAPWSVVNHPAQILAPVKTVIWWGFVEETISTRAYPWTIAETTELAQGNVFIEQPTAKILREAQGWRRPLLAPTERVMFIKPRTTAGHANSVHPFLHEFVELIDKASPSVRSKVIQQADTIYQNPEVAVFGQILKRRLIAHQQLPAPRAIWNVQAGVIRAKKESATSLERLLGCPLTWLLRSRAQINLGNILSLSEGEQLAGNLAHAVFASVFRGKKSQQSSVYIHAQLAFDELCPQIASPLLLPGKSLERQNLKTAICEAAVHLNGLIADAGFDTVDCEQEHHVASNEIEIQGRVDMLLEHKNATQDHVLDLKWTKRPVQRRRELVDGRAIQLAVYAWMCSGKLGRPVNAGYYMLSQKQLFCTSEEPFPPHTYVEGPPLTQTFQQIVSTYHEHMDYLGEGTIYATGVVDPLKPVLQTVDDEGSVTSVIPNVTFALEPPCKFCHYGRICGQKVFG